MRRRNLGSDVESEARRASDARALEFEKRWVAQIAKELDNLSENAYQRIGTISGLQAALTRLENTQVEATDDEIVSFIKRVRAALKRYDNLDELMSRLAEEATSLRWRWLHARLTALAEEERFS